MLSLIMLDDVDDDDNVYNADTSFTVSNFTPVRSKAPCSKATGACGGIRTQVSLFLPCMGTGGYSQLAIGGYAGLAGIRVCGYAGTRVCGYAGMRVRGYAGMRVRGYAGMRVCGYAGLRGRGFPAS